MARMPGPCRAGSFTAACKRVFSDNSTFSPIRPKRVGALPGRKRLRGGTFPGLVVLDVGAAPSLDILRVTFGDESEKPGIDTVIGGVDVDLDPAKDWMLNGHQVGLHDCVRVAPSHEDIPADGLRRSGRDELQDILAGDDDPAAKPQCRQHQNADDDAEYPERQTHHVSPVPGCFLLQREGGSKVVAANGGPWRSDEVGDKILLTGHWKQKRWLSGLQARLDW